MTDEGNWWWGDSCLKPPSGQRSRVSLPPIQVYSTSITRIYFKVLRTVQVQCRHRIIQQDNIPVRVPVLHLIQCGVRIFSILNQYSYVYLYSVQVLYPFVPVLVPVLYFYLQYRSIGYRYLYIPVRKYRVSNRTCIYRYTKPYSHRTDSTTVWSV